MNEKEIIAKIKFCAKEVRREYQDEALGKTLDQLAADVDEFAASWRRTHGQIMDAVESVGYYKP